MIQIRGASEYGIFSELFNLIDVHYQIACVEKIQLFEARLP